MINDRGYYTDGYVYNVLENHPSFPDNRSRRNITYDDFKWLLGNINFVKNFIEYCDMKRLRPVDLAIMVENHPEMIDLYDIDYDWDSLSGADWCKLIAYEPDYSNFCDWSKFDGHCWVELLRERPGFSNKCNWNSLNGILWQQLLTTKPEFAKYCKWERLDGYDWCFLLSTQPEIINDNEEAQLIAVEKDDSVLEKIDKPYKRAIELHEMLWVI